ncbi:MAG: anti-phage defense ZorAB system protein ZorA [Methylobacter sp.]|uniref:anti-phage ZorAB system protein ZorA n=1 Tax=Methylobacter sp. TaxID=2051955 RepID=UPI002582C172|nr:anti-phage ZorAB system protein ZorA [Methylobacter sp.]MCL7422565.1 anti-phage defense ZorAB system protein ZorA [Methylobacter sp.]
MKKTTFDLSSLWPDFSLLFNGGINQGEGLSAFFVLLLLIIAVLFFVYAVNGYSSATKKIRFYKDLIADIDQNELASKQRDLRNSALEHKEYGRLWKEFDESLVKSSDGTRLFNTLDAAHFFNESTLAGSLTQNRLLAAVPGFLTAIGVVGTFVGLQLALSQLQLQQNAGVDELRNGIGSLINGASIAFMTSIWGIGTSLVFNFAEKALERRIRKDIHDLQNQIDYLFLRINAEQSLVTIADHSRSADETLQGLAEKIGDRLQEALVETTASIQTGLENSLNQIMAPAIQSLVDNANKGSEQALESLLIRFMEGVGEAGNSQRLMMEQASANVGNAVNSMGAQMHDFVRQLEQHQQDSKQLADAQTEQIKAQIQQITEASQQTLARTAENTQEVFQNMQQRIQQQYEQQQEIDQQRQAVFEQGLEKSKESQQQVMDRIEQMLEMQSAASGQNHEQLKLLLDSFKQLAIENASVNQGMKQSSQQMASAANQLGVLSANLKETADGLSEPVMQLLESNQQVANENKAVFEHTQDLLSGLGRLHAQFGEVSKTLLQASEHAESGFTALDQHLEAFKAGLKTHINDLESELAKLLNDYSEQVQVQTYNRLNEWNEQTREYTTAMKDVVETMASIVDEIETKAVGSYA